MRDASNIRGIFQRTRIILLLIWVLLYRHTEDTNKESCSEYEDNPADRGDVCTVTCLKDQWVSKCGDSPVKDNAVRKWSNCVGVCTFRIAPQRQWKYILSSIYLVIHLEGSRPTRYGIRLDGDSPVSQLKAQLSTLSSLSIEQIGFFDSTPAYFRLNLFMDNDQTKIKQLPSREITAYELPLNKSCDASNEATLLKTPSSRYIIAIHRRLERQDHYLSPMTRHKIVFFGQPILVPYDKQSIEQNKITNEHIYNIVFRQLKRLLRTNKDLTNGTPHSVESDDALKERYPFVLKYVHEDGKKCSTCSWNR